MNNIPLVVHLIYRLDFGGLETLLAECINHMPPEKYRHAIVCLTDFTAFAEKIKRPEVAIYALHKSSGLGLGTHLKLWKLLRDLRPAILHTYNLSAIEYAFTATLAGVPIRVHAEHGRDVSDPRGTNWKHNLLRRFLIPFIHRFIPVSDDLRLWLKSVVGVPDAKNVLINNGVDTAHFAPGKHPPVWPESWDSAPGYFVIGTVGRIQEIKNHQGLLDAFIRLRKTALANERLYLAIVGDGPLFATLQKQVIDAGIAEFVWLPGSRTDIAEIMQSFSVFALPSLAEGTPVTILEAMSVGLPVVASRVGGIPDVVVDKVTGTLVPPSDLDALTNALTSYLRQPEVCSLHGAAGRDRVQQRYSLQAMLAAYTNLYDDLCKTNLKLGEPIEPCVE
jgi:sugar transferase (PEP-CTERM/EpsH1 system associated)